MKPWAIAGLLLVAGAFYLLIVREEPTPTQRASQVLSAWGEDLDRHARAHDWRYPSSLEDLEQGEQRDRETLRRDPWGRPYVYELHPEDATRCRVFSLGEDARPADRGGSSDVVLYRIRGRTIWKQALGDEPPEWHQLGP